MASLSASGGLVECATGLVAGTQRSFADAPDCEVLIYPGGLGARRQWDDPARLDWVRATRQRTPLMASVRTGSLVYAAAGLLAGRPATTHWNSLEQLRRLDPTVEVRADERFVDAGDVITAAGVSAGIDMALHLVVRLAGRERAREVRRGIHYDPAPPV